jgi:hypothetical protein
MLIKQVSMQLVFNKHYFLIANRLIILCIRFALEISKAKILNLNV